MNLLTLNEAKTFLEISTSDRVEDRKLNFLIEYASAWILEYLNRPDIEYKQRTEYYRGTGTKYLPLRCRPVSSPETIQIYIDSSAYYGATTGAFGTASALTYGSDFCLQLDIEEAAKSRSGLLIRINNIWPRPSARQAGYLSPFITPDTGSIKVTYYGGYTVDTLPTNLKLAAQFLIAKLRYIFPLGLEMNSESYEDRFISFAGDKKDYILSLVKPLLISYRNWKW